MISKIKFLSTRSIENISTVVGKKKNGKKLQQSWRNSLNVASKDRKKATQNRAFLST